MPRAAYIQLGVHPGEYCFLFLPFVPRSMYKNVRRRDIACCCVFPVLVLILAVCGILANPLIVFVLDFG